MNGSATSVHAAMAAHVAGGGVSGVVTLVSRAGEVSVDAIGSRAVDGHEPMTRDTVFRISSMTKPITAAATMILVEEAVLALDEPVDALLPELADRHVLVRLDSALDETVPAERPITVRDLLTFRMGIGVVPAAPGTYPIQTAYGDRRLGGDGPPQPDRTPGLEEWLRRLSELPLVAQPGEAWFYNTSSDVLGVLIARAAGQPFATFLRERIFEPLGMADTGFSVPADAIGRFATAYAADPETGALDVYDEPGGQWSHPPAFPSGGGGLVSTADDYLAFARMLLDLGEGPNGRILSQASVVEMTTDHLTAGQRAAAAAFLDGDGWGYGVTVTGTGRYGWDGGLGSSWRSDPRRDLIGILLTQSAWTSPAGPAVAQDFWAAIDA